MLAKATTTQADAVIADLEDSVAQLRHDLAIQCLEKWAPSRTMQQRWVRVRAADQGIEDIRRLRERRFRAFVLPKVNTLTDVANAAEAAGRHARLIPMIETAKSLTNVLDIASHPSVVRLLLGELDMRADTGVGDAPSGWDAMRVTVVVASAAHSKLPPIATPLRYSTILRS